MPFYFFQATRSAHVQITSLFDFIAPTATAMWNLRWQVSGYLSVLPGATKDQLDARFTEGTDIRGANLQRACIDHSWEEQKDAFGRIVLVNAIAIYEGWIEEILKSLGKNSKSLQIALQSPDPLVGTGSGVSWAISSITASESADLRDLFHPSLSKGKNYALPKLQAMMLCFRFFKELRNCDMHRGGIADYRLVDAFNLFHSVATPSLLGVSEVPCHVVPLLNKPVKISLRGAIGFTAIIFKIIATLDAEFCRSDASKKPFIDKWKMAHKSCRTLPSDRKKRAGTINTMAANAGFPLPTDPNKLGEFLKVLRLTQF